MGCANKEMSWYHEGVEVAWVSIWYPRNPRTLR